MIRRDIGDEAGARSDGVMIVSIIFITAFTYIALTTDPVYTGIGVGDRAPDLNGQIYDGTVWVDFELGEQFNDTWSEGEPGTYYLVEFMDTNCGICVSAAEQKFTPQEQAAWLGDNPQRPMPEGISVEFLAVSISLWDESVSGKSYGRTVVEDFREAYSHNFPYMDMQDNSHQDDWGNFGTPTYFLIDPSGIIQYTNLETPGYDFRDALDDIVPRGA